MGTRPAWKQSTPGGQFSFVESYMAPGSFKSYDYRKNNNNSKRNRHYKYLYAVIALLCASPVNAETVGGVSATALPVANSSPVTNQQFRFYKVRT
ncbi:MAG: hypothetical protein CM15mV41_0370 [Caudoviricetes sp.]|nr:MAG: hypothetical protein CM15mV41_0370 [Caudoviricetes sp.]